MKLFLPDLYSIGAGFLNVNDLLLNELEPDLYFQNTQFDTSYNGMEIIVQILVKLLKFI